MKGVVVQMAARLDELLKLELENGSYYSLEGLAAKYHVDKAEIHRSFMRLSRQNGWSIRPYNDFPKGRDHYRYWGGSRELPHKNSHYNQSWREKGEKYVHDIGKCFKFLGCS